MNDTHSVRSGDEADSGRRVNTTGVKEKHKRYGY